MKLKEQQINEVLTMDLEDAYNFYITCMQENKELEEHYEQIRFGINITFDIHDIFDKFVTIKPKNGIVRIRGKSHKLIDYRTEVEKRHAKIKKAIIDHITEPNEIYKELENK